MCGEALPRGSVCAVAVHAGVAEAAICLRLAVGMVEALGAHAAEAVHLVHTRAPVVARAGRALVDVRVAAGPWGGETALAEQHFNTRALALQQHALSETRLREAKAAAWSSVL